jgi:hypothetical protein
MTKYALLYAVIAVTVILSARERPVQICLRCSQPDWPPFNLLRRSKIFVLSDLASRGGGSKDQSEREEMRLPEEVARSW